jgi:acetamidase/formamidase
VRTTAGNGVVLGSPHLTSTPETVLWGELPCEADDSVATMDPGNAITIETVSHEGILPDQGDIPTHLGYAYLSAAADVRISQVVDRVKGCHTVIRKADFREWT